MSSLLWGTRRRQTRCQIPAQVSLHVRTIASIATLVMTLPLTLARGQSWPEWRLTPDLRVDGETNDLSAITFVQVGRTGAIAIGQEQDAQVLLFSATGQRLASTGRSGSGPGEFRQIFFRAGWLGDSLWVFDRGLYRLSILSPAGRVIRTFRIPSAFDQSRYLLKTRVLQPFFGWVGAGDTLFYSALRYDADSVLHHLLMRGSTAGALRGIVAEYTTRPDCAWVSSAGFCAEPKWAASPTGERFAIVTSSAPQQRRGAFTATMASARGDTLFSREYLVATDRIAPSDIASRTLDPRELPAVRAFERFEPMTDVIIGRDSALWIGRDGHAGRTYVVIDGSGNTIGSVHFAKKVRVMASDRTHVWTVEEDQTGLQSVVRYRVERPR